MNDSVSCRVQIMRHWNLRNQRVGASGLLLLASARLRAKTSLPFEAGLQNKSTIMMNSAEIKFFAFSFFAFSQKKTKNFCNERPKMHKLKVKTKSRSAILLSGDARFATTAISLILPVDRIGSRSDFDG